MADPARHMQFNVNNDDNIAQDNQDNDGKNCNDSQNNDQEALQPNVQVAAPVAAQTTLVFKVEQSKIPEFFGQKGKDNIPAIVFIRKIVDLAQTNWWNDTTTYANVANTLKGFAHDWLFATVEVLDWTGDQLTWTNLKPRFQRQFATQTDEKLIIEGLSNLAMKPYKSTGQLLARITNTMVIIKDSYADYENKVAAPAHHDINGGYAADTAMKWRNNSVNNTIQFFKM
jgi:hypothetical protein